MQNKNLGITPGLALGERQKSIYLQTGVFGLIVKS
jgi:hypothetical protein